MANKEHSALFRSRSIATDLLAPLLGRAFEKLEELHDQGKIPNTTIPVLQDRLAADICICGETLAPGDAGGKKRRAHIQKLIDDSLRADEIQEIITNLYYGAKPLQNQWGTLAPASGWKSTKRSSSAATAFRTCGTKRAGSFRALEMQTGLPSGYGHTGPPGDAPPVQGPARPVLVEPIDLPNPAHRAAARMRRYGRRA